MNKLKNEEMKYAVKVLYKVKVHLSSLVDTVVYTAVNGLQLYRVLYD